MQWCMGPFRLDADHACLWRGEARVRLRPKPFDILVYLVEHAGELVSKDELMDAVWPETAVTDSVLTMAISELRKVLGETARAPYYIATEHRRGYRFIAPVTPLEPASSLPPTAPVPAHEPLPSAESLPPREAERRQLTVLFCDLVGSTSLANQLDLEDYREVVQAYSETCAAVITRFDGHIAQYLGDGILVYFGYPQAHEDDAQRAVWAGLGLLEAVAALSFTLTLPPADRLSVRLGVHTGPVVVDVVGTGEHQESLALGETPNIAARLQHLAEPDTLLISASTYALIEGYFRCKSLGAHTLRERLADVPHQRLHYQCSPYHSNSAFYPFVVQFEWMLRQEPESLANNQIDRLEALLAQASLPIADLAPLLAALLSLPSGALYPSIPMSPQRQKDKTIEALVALMLGLSKHEPVVGIVEDVHWIDPTSLETLERMVEQVQESRVLLVITARPEFVPRWGEHTHMTSHTLNRLSRRQVTAMVERLTVGKPLPGEVVDQIMDKTDGMPLFVEELTKTILESGLLMDDDAGYGLMGSLSQLAIPATLQDTLMARLDRLEPTAKEMAQMGSVLGREFADELLGAISPLPEAMRQEALDQLIVAGLIFRRGTAPEVTYRFKHALVQEAAYTSLLRQRRRQLHATVAQVLVEQFSTQVEAAPEVVAHHYTEAGDATQAIPYWHQAGNQAIARSAHVEAISHLTTGLEVLSMLPESPARASDELRLQRALGTSLIATRGFAAAEVEKTYARAQELCRQVHDTEQLFPVLFGLWGFYDTRGALQKAREIAEYLIALAQPENDPALLVPGYRALGETFFHLGEFVQARTYLERGLFFYDPEQHRTHALLYGHDAGVSCLGFGARALWLLSYPDQALHRSCEAVSLAQTLSHPFSLSFALILLIHLHHHRREPEMVLTHSETLISLATEQGFPQGVAHGTCLRGWALAMQGHLADGITHLRQGIAAYQDAGFQVSRPHQLPMLAEVLGKSGEVEAGLSLLAEAQARVEHLGSHRGEAELYRVRGELLQRLDRGIWHMDGTPESCFRRALDIARQQQAKSLELRAAMSLCRLWQQQGKRDEAHALLAPIYGWFTEGFDTADLQDARALLEMLGRST